MTSEVTRGGPPPITVSLSDVEDANLGRKNFRTEADYSAFLDAVATARDQKAAGIADPKLEIPKPYGAEALGLIDAKLKQFGVLLDDTMLEVLKVMHEQSVLDKQVGRETRKAEQQTEIAKMKDAADEIRAAGLARAIQAGVGGLMTMASGVVSGIGAAKAMKTINAPVAGAAPGATPGTAPGTTPGTPSQTNLNNQLNNVNSSISQQQSNLASSSPTPATRPRSNAVSGQQHAPQQGAAPSAAPSDAMIARQNLQGQITLAKWNAAGEGFKAAGQLGGAPLEYIAADHEARRAEIDAEAKKHGYQAQEADEIQRSNHEALGSIRSTIQEIQRSISQTQSTIWA